MSAYSSEQVDELIARLRYQGKQYTAGQYARGGGMQKHWLEEAADALAALKADAERIEWLGANPRESSVRVGTDFKACIFYGVACDAKWTVREAIDAARAKEQG